MNARPATADRDAIRAAIDRLLAGTPLRSKTLVNKGFRVSGAGLRSRFVRLRGVVA
jgi:hypothetical protein